MRFKYLLIILLFIPFFVFSQVEKRPLYAPRKEKHRNTYDAKGKQGTWKFFTRNKDLFLEVNFENDLKNGPCIRYFTSTAAVREEINYYYGVKEGDYKSYFVSGATKSEGAFKKNRRDGHWIFYHGSTGEKSTEGDYLNGKKVDEWIYYNRKGEMICKGNYKNDAKDGIWHFYDSDGKEIRAENNAKIEAPVSSSKAGIANKNNKIIPKNKNVNSNIIPKNTVPLNNSQVSSLPPKPIVKDTKDANQQTNKQPVKNTSAEPLIKVDTIKKTNKAKINFSPSK